MKFIENIINRFQFIVQTRNCVTKFKGKLLKKCKCKLQFLNSACHLILVDICMKIHEDSLKTFQAVERTRLRRNFVMVEVPWEITQEV